MRQRKFAGILCILMLMICCFGGCQTQKNNEKSQKISVVTTIFPAFDFAREIAGEYADVSMLLRPGTESHSFEPSPADMIAVENCDIFIYNANKLLGGIFLTRKAHKPTRASRDAYLR